jgi:hypothetical protein
MSRVACMLVAASCAVACGGDDSKPRPEPVGQCGAQTLTGADDPGSGPIDCAALEAYDVQLIDDFETGAATGWYINNDRTALQTPAPDTDPVPGERIPGGRCRNEPSVASEYAVHVLSGNLTEFGAVFGRNMRRRLDASPCPISPCLGRTPPPPSVGPCGVGQATPGQDAVATECTTGADASEWEGIVLWARNGPGSTSGVRIQVSDPRTDDSNQACVCNPFTNQNDTSDGCDKFGRFINVDSTWRAYRVPFAEMQQGGWGLASPSLDTSGLFSVTVQMGRGAWDLWIDDIGFYRRQR